MQRHTRGSRRIRGVLGCLTILTSACPGLDSPAGNAGSPAFGAAGSPESQSGAGTTLGGTPPLDADDVGDSADPSAQSRAVDTASSAAGSARWKQAASVTGLHGRVLDAVSGMPVQGAVYTTSECTGCMLAADEKTYATPIENGVFTFSGTLTLHPESSFTIDADGYRDITIAHGPKVPVEGETINRSENELPTLYVCAQDAADTDHDGICDAAEKRYGTLADQRDSDGDSLSDTMELYGHPYSGTEDYYDIYSLGADPMHRDIFLAIRFTQRSRLDRMAFPLVHKAFDKAPPMNPDGKTGIHLHILFDDHAISGRDDVVDLNPVWTVFDQLKPAYFGDRPAAFHHVLWANKYNGETSSGVSRDWGAAELVVTLGAFENHGTVLEQAGTLMHELGHNLGLHHNGYTDEGYVPHYMSIMSYAYQMTGIERTDGTALDYAGIEIAPFNEGDIDETAPFMPAGATTKDVLKSYLNPRVMARMKAEDKEIPRLMGNLGGQLDFNGDGKFTKNVKVDLNRESAMQPEFFDRYPATRNDWASLEYGGGPRGPIGDMLSAATNRMVVKDFQEMPPCLRPLKGGATAGATMNTPASSSSTPASSSSMPSTASKTPPTTATKPTANPKKPATSPSKPTAKPKTPATDPNKPAKQPRANPKDSKDKDSSPSDASVPDSDASPFDVDASVPDAEPFGGETPDAAVPEADAAVEERDAAIEERDAAIEERDAAVEERDAAVEERDAAVEKPSTDPNEPPIAQPDASIEDPAPEPGDQPPNPGVPEEGPNPPDADPPESPNPGSEQPPDDGNEQPDAGVFDPDPGIW
jgi:hypothetical protein